jgi:beta-lactamase regulating signal transducer with metallopeptidase domain
MTEEVSLSDTENTEDSANLSEDVQVSVHPVNHHETKSKQETATYSDKTNRLIAWSDIIKNASRLIWIVVIFIVLTGIWGKFEASKTISTYAKLITYSVPKLSRTFLR